MNTLVKVFIVINLILSALFCSFSLVLFANRQDWKQKYTDRTKELTTEKDRHATKEKKLSDTLSKTQEDLASSNADKSKFKDDLDAKKDEFTKLKSMFDNLETDHTGLKSNHSILDDRYQKLREDNQKTSNELAKYREIASNTESDLVVLKEKYVNLEQSRANLVADKEAAINKRNEIEKENKELQWMLSKLEQSGVDVATIIAKEGQPDKPIHAKVVAVKGTIALLSVGKKDNVKPGHRFTVYNSGIYKGKVQVESVFPDYASARVILPLQPKDQTIREGDNASTRPY